jgi:hypothetical protein
MADQRDIVPPQRVGNKLDTFHECTAASDEEARNIFTMAATRMLDVNSWEKICGPISAKFRLTDEEGKSLQRPAKPGDFFCIDVPGPGPSAGDGFDWVKVEALDDRRGDSSAEESITMRVRPAPSPENNDRDTAHFFTDDATSSFRVARHGRTVRAEVHGRNERPNTEVHNAADKLRNAVVGTGAVAGISKPQWNSLVKGLLDTSIDS